MAMAKGTSFPSAYLLGTALFLCSFGWNMAERRSDEASTAPQPEPETSNFFQRHKRQSDGGRSFGSRRNPFFQNSATNFGNNELIFSGRPTTTARPFFPPQNSNNNQNNNNDGDTNPPGQLVFINNRPTIATVAPFTGRTTASPQYMACFNRCRTTPEYNPICGSDQELYFNEQKFNCARSCGADIQIVRRGSCQGLFPMMRG